MHIWFSLYWFYKGQAFVELHNKIMCPNASHCDWEMCSRCRMKYGCGTLIGKGCIWHSDCCTEYCKSNVCGEQKGMKYRLWLYPKWKMFMKLVFMWLSKYDFLVSDHVSKNITKSTDSTIEYRGLKRKRNQGLQRLRQVLLSWNRVLQAIWMVHLSYLQSIIPVYANKESIKE